MLEIQHVFICIIEDYLAQNKKCNIGTNGLSANEKRESFYLSDEKFIKKSNIIRHSKIMVKSVLDFIQSRMVSCEKYARKKGVKIGKGCSISTRNFPTEAYLIEIGDYVRIATKVSFFTHGGIWSVRKIYNDKNLDHFGKIKIGNYSYVGEGCMIMSGVTIGEKCIVGGGSVVTKSVPDGCMVAGNPAKFIGYTEDFYKRLKEKSDVKCAGMSFEEKKQYLLSLPETAFERKPYIKLPEK